MRFGQSPDPHRVDHLRQTLGLISQFKGYDILAELDWKSYRAGYGNIQRLDRIREAEGDDINRYKAATQADTLMLLYLLSSDELGELLDRPDYDFPTERIPAMVDYYVARTSHGSNAERGGELVGSRPRQPRSRLGVLPRCAEIRRRRHSRGHDP